MRGRRHRLMAVAATAAALCAGAVPAAPAAGTVGLVQVGTAATPVSIAAATEDPSRLYVVEQGGTIKVLREGTASTFLDLTARVTAAAPGAYGERGLLGLAFAPDFASSRRLYVYFTARGTNAITIARYIADSPDAARDSTFEPLLSIPHDRQGNHNGGQLQFGPDGMLYAGTGDGGGGGDPSGNAQDLTSPPSVAAGVNHDARLGKLLRLDVSPASGYRTAAGNPFAAPAQDVWALGLRNPFRFSFDRATGEFFIGDVGQNDYEEIDAVGAGTASRGLNFGWNRFEGMHGFPGGGPVSPLPAGFAFPAVERTHADGWCSITGGYVVRDPALPDLLGRYVYSDYCRGRIHAVRIRDGVASGDATVPGLPAIAHTSTFGEDAAGRIHVASQDGAIFRLEQVGGTGTPSDVIAPRIFLSRTVAQRPVRTGRVATTVRCSERCTVRLSGTILVAGRRRPAGLRSLRRTLDAGVSARLAVRLTRLGARHVAPALRAQRRVAVRLSVRATDAAGNVGTRTQLVRVQR